MTTKDPVKELQSALERRIEAAFAYSKAMAADMEQYAKGNAPWTDRTGDARKLLQGIAILDTDTGFDVYDNKEGTAQKTGTETIAGKGFIGVAIVHRVEYGKDLEVRASGKNAILKPTLEHFRAEYMQGMQRIFGDTV